MIAEANLVVSSNIWVFGHTIEWKCVEQYDHDDILLQSQSIGPVYALVLRAQLYGSSNPSRLATISRYCNVGESIQPLPYLGPIRECLPWPPL